MHEVLRVLAARAQAGRPYDDGLRVALAIEGGGMRGTVSAGMAFGLNELGLVPAFDAVYGASAGAITAAWLLSRPDGLRGWTEPAYARAFIRRSGLVRGRPVADVRALIEELYQTTFPMDFAAVLASPIEFHPLATDAATGQSTDLRPFVGTPAELRLALRASAALPLLAGPPVEFAGRRFYDAGLSESVPYRTALAQGATHVLVLRSRRNPVIWPDGRAPSRSVRLIARTTLRRESPALRAVFLSRDARLAADDRHLTE
jgi:predicted patatin/cPLA2 family phospholipase